MKKILTITFVLLLILSINAVSFAAYKVTLTAEPEEGGTVTGGGEYEEGKNADILATPAEGYTFVGWFKPEEDTPFSTEPAYTYEQEADRSYIARFEKALTVGIIADPATGGVVTQSGGGDYVLDASVTLTAKANDGYTFIGWFDSSSTTEPVSTESTYTFNVASSVSYIARFSPQYQLDVNITPETGGSVLGAGQYAGGSIVMLEAVPADQYRFVGWVFPADPNNIISTDSKYTFNLDDNLTLTAKFARSYGYIWLRIGIIAAICVAAFFVIVSLIRRSQTIKRRKSRTYGHRPPQQRPPQRPRR